MSVYQNETLTYAELVSRTRELGNEYRVLNDDARPLVMREPDGPSAAWEITFRADPHVRFTGVVFEMQMRPRGEVFGLWVARDDGDEAARLTLDGYYAAVARLIVAVPAVGITESAGAAAWRTALEADTPEAAELDEIIGVLHMYWFYKRTVAEKKSAAPTNGGATGETSE